MRVIVSRCVLVGARARHQSDITIAHRALTRIARQHELDESVVYTYTCVSMPSTTCKHMINTDCTRGWSPNPLTHQKPAPPSGMELSPGPEPLESGSRDGVSRDSRGSVSWEQGRVNRSVTARKEGREGGRSGEAGKARVT